MATKKTKKFRAAKSGPTIDGRNISPEELRQIAATYNPALYTARVFVEHLRGFSADGSFPACGDVLDVEARDEDGGVSLYATVEANQNLITFNAKDQKVFPSIEIVPNFAETGKAYLGGMGITDSPASLGTERISFSANVSSASGSRIFRSSSDGVPLEFEEDGGFSLEKFKSWLSDTFRDNSAPAPTPAPAPAPAPDVNAFNAKAIADAVAAQLMPNIGAGFSQIAQAVADNEKKVDAISQRIADVENHHAKTDGNPVNRPVATGSEPYTH